MKHKSKLLCGIVAALLCSSVSAYEIDVDGGMTWGTPVGNGNWYQNGFPHTLRTNSPTASIKIFTDPVWNDIQIGFGFDFIGRFTTDAMVLDSDENYNSSSPTHCNGTCGPLSHMQGQGTDPSAFLVIRKNNLFRGPILSKVFIEADMYASRESYENTNFDWYGGTNNSVGPIVSHIDHQVVTKYDLSVAIGYRFTENISAMVKAVPTHAPNTQYYQPTNSLAYFNQQLRDILYPLL